jgi:hypothetical protein
MANEELKRSVDASFLRRQRLRRIGNRFCQMSDRHAVFMYRRTSVSA